MPTFLAIMLSVLAVSAAVLLVIFVMVPVFKGIAWVITRIFDFIFSEIGDFLRIFGSLIATVVFIPLVLVNIVIGRWSAAAHFGRSVQGEVKGIGHCFYRLVVGNPARLFGLNALTEGLERRLPEAMAKAPGADKPSHRTGQFAGYKIVGSLKGGGSGARIYIAEPDAQKLAAFARFGRPDVEQVVIKSFSLSDGSSLPQIVRESRALEAAKKIGLVLEHELNDQRFFYVMPYVPGDDLTAATRRLHSAAGPDGLRGGELREALGYVSDLVRTLDRYHRGGLWHKDVKPDNIIVAGGGAHLVDLGLVTPLRSAMTLTTHGTEYFRDPEMVRMALKGVKVHEVDGAKFDIYAAGAVLYAVVENSFPAHGGLSQVTKRCPEAVRWIIRRAMTEYDRRYPTTAGMLADLAVVLAAPDPFAIKPVDLPSMSGRPADAVEAELREAVVEPVEAPAPAGRVVEASYAAATPIPPRPVVEPQAHSAPADRRRPFLRVANWWTGGYVDETGAAPGPRPQADHGFFVNVHAGVGAPRRPLAGRPSAREQLASARKRVDSARRRAHARMNRHRRFSNAPNPGMAVALLVFLGVAAAGAFGLLSAGGYFRGGAGGPNVTVHHEDDAENPSIEIDFTEVRARASDFAREIGRAFGRAPVIVNEGMAEIRQAQARSALVPTTPVSDGSLWIVIDDLKGAPGETRQKVEDAIERLRDNRFNVAAKPEGDDQIELLASARKTIGLGLPNDPATRDRLTQWVTDRSDEIAGVVWTSWDSDGKTPRFAIFGVSETDLDRAKFLLQQMYE